MKLGFSVLILVGASCLGSAQVERPTTGPLLEKPDMAKMFKWFDGLDFDAVHTGQFVRLSLNSFWNGNARFEYGFEVSPNKILTLDLDYSQRVPDKLDGAYLDGPYYVDFKSFEPVDFATFAKSQLPILYGKDPSDKRRLVQGDIAAFVMARACSDRGLPELAEKYFVWATQSRYKTDSVSGVHTIEVTGPLPKGQGEEGRFYGEWIDYSGYNDVKHYIERTQYLDAIESLSDTRLTWQQRLAEFQRVQRLFGDVDAKEPASEYVRTLATMVAETPVPDDPAHEIDRLIQQLPSESARQALHPGSAQVFSPFAGTSNDSPAHKLARIGRPAVPKLLAALDDQRLTQSFSSDLNRFHVLRVWEIVIQILDEIANREFQAQPGSSRQSSRDEIRAAVREWYEAAGKVGELEVLKADLQTVDGYLAVNKIEEKFPDKARGIYFESFPKIRFSVTKSYVLSRIATILDATSIPFLKNVAVHGDLASDRIYAASRLATIDRAFAGRVLVKELAAHRDPEGFFFDVGVPSPSLYECLIENGSPDAISAVAKDLRSRPVEVRSEILRNYVERFPTDASAAAQSSTEALLVSELDDPDTEPVNHEVNDIDGRSSMEDLAATDLGKLFPSKYPYQEFRFETDRKRQRLYFTNIWRKGRGLAPLLDTSKTLRPIANKSTIVAVEVSGESPSNAKIAAVARKLLGKPITFDGFLSVVKSFDQLKMPKGRYARFIITRESRGAGLTLHVDFYRHGSGDMGSEQSLFNLYARIDDKMIGVPARGFSVESRKNQFETCLAAPVSQRIDVEYDYWTLN